jgi:hypothetical protein
MAPQTSIDLISTLTGSLETLREALAGITEEDARKCPGPGQWSAVDCVEHLTIAEQATLARLKTAEPVAEPVDLPEREAAMTAVVSGRATRIQGPPAAMPTGRFASLSEALEAFAAARGRTIEFVQTVPNLRSLQVTHPFFGPITAYELAAITAAHSVRHSLQIREIRQYIE